MCFNFIFNLIFNFMLKLRSTLSVLTFEVRMIYVHLGFFLWLLLTPFIHVKERKTEKN